MANYLDKAGLQTLVDLLKSYVDGKVDNLDLDIFVFVDALPSTGESGKIYFVPDSNDDGDNNFVEWVWNDGSWEKLGEAQVKVDLDGYVNEVTASGTSPLTLGATKSGSSVSITGSVASATSSSPGLMTAEQAAALEGLSSGAVTSVSASGTSPLTLTGSVSGNALTLTGSVADATASVAGVVRPYTVLSSSPDVNSATDEAGRYYGVSTDSSNRLVVNVPWSDTEVTLSDLGGVGSVSASGTAPLTLSASKSGTAVTVTGSVSAATTSASGLMSAADKTKLDALEEMTAITTAEIEAMF